MGVASVEELGRSALPAGATLTAPHAFRAAPPVDDARFGPSLEEDGARYLAGELRPANSFQGQAHGLGVNIVVDPKAAGLDPRALGTCWWMGLSSTYFAYNRASRIGCIVLAQEWTCLRRT